MNRVDNTHATFLNCLRDWSDPFLNGGTNASGHGSIVASGGRKQRGGGVHDPTRHGDGTLGCVRCESCSCRLNSTTASTSSSSHLSDSHALAPTPTANVVNATRPTASSTKSPSARSASTSKSNQQQQQHHQSPRLQQHQSPRLQTPKHVHHVHSPIHPHQHQQQQQQQQQQQDAHNKSFFKPIIKPTKRATPASTVAVGFHKPLLSSSSKNVLNSAQKSAIGSKSSSSINEKTALKTSSPKSTDSSIAANKSAAAAVAADAAAVVAEVITNATALVDQMLTGNMSEDGGDDGSVKRATMQLLTPIQLQSTSAYSDKSYKYACSNESISKEDETRSDFDRSTTESSSSLLNYPQIKADLFKGLLLISLHFIDKDILKNCLFFFMYIE